MRRRFAPQHDCRGWQFFRFRSTCPRTLLAAGAHRQRQESAALLAHRPGRTRPITSEHRELVCSYRGIWRGVSLSRLPFPSTLLWNAYCSGIDTVLKWTSPWNGHCLRYRLRPMTPRWISAASKPCSHSSRRFSSSSTDRSPADRRRFGLVTKPILRCEWKMSSNISLTKFARLLALLQICAGLFSDCRKRGGDG